MEDISRNGDHGLYLIQLKSLTLMKHLSFTDLALRQTTETTPHLYQVFQISKQEFNGMHGTITKERQEEMQQLNLLILLEIYSINITRITETLKNQISRNNIMSAWKNCNLLDWLMKKKSKRLMKESINKLLFNQKIYKKNLHNSEQDLI